MLLTVAGSNMCPGGTLSGRLFCVLFLLWQAGRSISQTSGAWDYKKENDTTIANEIDLSAPLEVLVEETTSDSVTLSWKRPRNPRRADFKLFTYSLVLTPLTHFGNGLEKEFSLPPGVTTKRVQGLTEGTRYAVQLTAVYGDPAKVPSRGDLLRVSAPKFTVFVPPDLQQDVPVGDDGIPTDEPACNCSDVGMVACLRRPGFQECTCQPGYSGQWCEECAPGNFRAGKECKLCPCSNLTSTAECTMDSSSRVSCVRCLPGHRGGLCNSCTAGYHWTEERCVPLDCLSPRLCAQQRDSPGCRDCEFLDSQIPATAHRSNTDRGSIADGTLPLIAVVVTLGVLLLVAAMATCYRYWDYRRHQPRIPFWSIELQDDKSELHAHCQYQHLDAATNRAVAGPPPTTAGPPPAHRHGGEVGRLKEDSVGRNTYNSMDL